jgi:ribosomal protein S18 acetylase RimI-like enzyme
VTHPLDRPVWNALNGRQAGLAVAQGAAVRIDPRYGPFAAARDDGEEAQDALVGRLKSGEEVWLVESEAWPTPPGMHCRMTAPLLQMVGALPDGRDADDGCIPLDETHAEDMRALALATEPGPWAERTHRYGPFFGIVRDGRLEAMAGERMLPAPGLAEVSGVCTWPEFRGQGHAARLIRRVIAGFAERGDTPFLHSYAGNAKAIALYESLGFRPRREMVVTVLVRE